MSTQDARDLRVIADSLDTFRERYDRLQDFNVDDLRDVADAIEMEEHKRQCRRAHFHVPKWHKVFREGYEQPAAKVIDSENKSWFISMKVANVYATPANARAVAYDLWRELDKQHGENE